MNPAAAARRRNVATVKKKYYTRSHVRTLLDGCLYWASCSSCREEEDLQEAELRRDLIATARYEEIGSNGFTTTAAGGGGGGGTKLEVGDGAPVMQCISRESSFEPYQLGIHGLKYREKSRVMLVHNMAALNKKRVIPTLLPPLSMNLLEQFGIDVTSLIRACISVDELYDNRAVTKFSDLVALGLCVSHLVSKYASSFFSLERIVDLYEVKFRDLHRELDMTLGDLIKCPNLSADLLVAMKFTASDVDSYIDNEEDRVLFLQLLMQHARLSINDLREKLHATEQQLQTWNALCE